MQKILKKRYFLVAILLLLGNPFYAQLPKVELTEKAQVSLLTCSEGEELYSLFGHSAIRVSDPSLGLDWVFNYGTFDFSDPKFYTNFVRGKLNYILSVSTYPQFEYSYVLEGRHIHEQTLNITHQEKQLLLDSLSINYLPENRYYLYDFLYDNCATRIRDIFVEAIPRGIEFDYGLLEGGESFRQLLMPNVHHLPWVKLGINMLLGVGADRPAELWEYMFLPQHMEDAFSTATIGDGGVVLPLVEPTVVLLGGQPVSPSTFPHSPLFFFTLFLLIIAILSYWDMKRQKPRRWVDVMTFGVVGLVGVVLAFQWFFSDHWVMSNNYNLIWANPLHLVGVVALLTRALSRFARAYFGAYALLTLLLVAFWFLIPQSLPTPVLPLVAAMGLRAAVLFRLI